MRLSVVDNIQYYTAAYDVQVVGDPYRRIRYHGMYDTYCMQADTAVVEYK